MCKAVGFNGTILDMVPVTVTAVDAGFALDLFDTGCLEGVTVEQTRTDHPNAGAAQQTGAYWTVTPVPASCTSGFSGSLTLPTSFQADAGSQICRYLGVGTSWDCDQNGFASSSVSRWGITQSGDFAVGKGVLPSVAIAKRSVTEGNTGTANAGFKVTLSAASSQTVTVNYATANATAQAGSDYLPAVGTLSFAPGETTKNVTIVVNGDTAYEKNETFFVNLSGASRATITAAQAKGTIKNDDPLPSTSIADAAITEGNSGTKTLKFTVTLSAASGLAASVKYATMDGTATAGSDYVAKSGTVKFPAGATSKTITITINGDTAPESSEAFSLNLTNPVTATIADGNATGTLVNDD
jgi:hypothetical protein